MDAPRTPRLQWMPASQLDDDTWHSLLISLLRGAAALQVAAAHVRAEFFPGLRSLDNPTLWYQALAFFTGFAHQAVVVFFLISGYLVGGSLLNKLGQPDALRLYAIDRISRLWTVLIPTFALIVLLGIVGGQLDPRNIDLSPSNPYSLTAFAGNLFGLQTVTLKQFGGNYPLWSLANESWYYLMFPLLMLVLPGTARTSGRRLAAAGALALLCWFLPFDMVLYFALWLLGAAFSRVRIVCGNAARTLLACAMLAVAAVIRLKGSNDDLVLASFVQDLIFSLVFLLLLATTVVKLPPLTSGLGRVKKTAAWFSAFSFTLYVIHVPFLGVLHQLGIALFGSDRLDPSRLSHLALYGAMLVAVVVFAYGFYLLFEAHTYKVRRFLKNLLAQRPVAPARPAPAKH